MQDGWTSSKCVETGRSIKMIPVFVKETFFMDTEGSSGYSWERILSGSPYRMLNRHLMTRKSTALVASLPWSQRLHSAQFHLANTEAQWPRGSRKTRRQHGKERPNERIFLTAITAAHPSVGLECNNHFYHSVIGEPSAVLPLTLSCPEGLCGWRTMCLAAELIIFCREKSGLFRRDKGVFWSICLVFAGIQLQLSEEKEKTKWKTCLRCESNFVRKMYESSPELILAVFLQWSFLIPLFTWWISCRVSSVLSLTFSRRPWSGAATCFRRP